MLSGISCYLAENNIPDNKIELKTFHNAIQNDHSAIREEEAAYQPIPKVRDVDQAEVLMTYHQIKEDIKLLVDSVLSNLCWMRK